MNICSVSYCTSKVLTKNNLYCGKHFQRFKRNGDPTKLLRNNGVGITPEERFWSRVEKKENECWEWQAHLVKGYGSLTVDKQKHVAAHRASWFYTYGKWPDLNLLHSCDNRKCVNPDHIFEGTKKENSEDMVRKGRSMKGEKQPLSKLKEYEVKEIKNLLNIRSLSAIAKEFNVSISCISAIKRGDNWGWLNADN